MAEIDLKNLQKLMRDRKIFAYLQPMGDEFQSEYTPLFARRLPLISGFDGSAGFGIVFADDSENKNILLTDGRYHLQAERQIYKSFEMLDSGQNKPHEILQKLPEKSKIAVNSWLFSYNQLTAFKTATKNVEWDILNADLVSEIWADAPKLPDSAITLQPISLTGVSYIEKRAQILEIINKNNAYGLLICAPDSINWLLNIRASDIEFNPLSLGYLLVKADGCADFFTFKRNYSTEVINYFAEHKINILDISLLWQGAQKIAENGAKIIADFASLPYGFYKLCESQKISLEHLADPCILPKACKNNIEIKAVTRAHLLDGVAICKFLHWLEGQHNSLPDEIGVAEKLEYFRALSPEYKGASFATIAGFAENGAIIHYRAEEKTSKQLELGNILLLDSGGQYNGGTTDVTRTIAIGNVEDAEIKRNFTLVLKGHIALASSVFPVGTTGHQLDVLARQFLWQNQLDYEHGTGHGVGAELCVHEGPQSISKRAGGAALQPGMVISNEPGFYKAGAYGIRIENLVHVVALDAAKKWLQLVNLTLVPIDKKLIVKEMLSKQEIDWINNYHRTIYNNIAPLLDNAEIIKWLKLATAEI